MSKIYEHFYLTVKKKPGAIALIYKDQKYSYKDLSKTVDIVAAKITELKTTPKPKIAVYTKRSYASVVILLAILKIDGIYIPLDLSYPHEYIDYILKDTQADFIVGFKDLLEKLNAGVLRAEIDDLFVINEIVNNGKENECLTKEDISFIFYTSGSTGKPKGVMQNQDHLLNCLSWFWQHYPFAEKEMTCQLTSINFLPSLFEFFQGLLQGVSTLIIDEENVKDPNQLLEWLAKYRVTRLRLVPSLLKMLLGLNNKNELNRKLSCLKYILSGGERLTVNLYNEFKKTLTDTILLNEYGATEVNAVLVYEVENKRYRDLTSIPVGFPIANVKAYVLDEQLRPVPAQQEGFLYIESPYLSPGYLNNDALNNEKFLPSPFSEKERIFKTGDIVKQLADGSILYVGRRDNQIKIRGKRVSLETIEATIASVSGIKENAVILNETKNNHQQLIAYVVSERGQKELIPRIRKEFTKKLPSYFLPQLFIELEDLPRTISGKVDRVRLSSLNQQQVAPQCDKSSIQGFLTYTIASVLEIDPKTINISDEFYVLGLDSITSAVLIEKLNSAYSCNVKITSLYDYSTIINLAGYLATAIAPDQPVSESAPKKTKATLSSFENTNGHEDCGQMRPGFESRPTQLEDEEIAIVGFSCRFPDASNPWELWRNLCEGRSSVGILSENRWQDMDGQAFNLERTDMKGSFFTNTDLFDADFFSITPSDAAVMDPQQRFCLEECYKALEMSGHSKASLSEKKVGVFIGARSSDYLDLIKAKKLTPSANILLGNDDALLAAHISYFLNLKGPCIALDTACSSSLSAIHLAHRSLENGECDIALAGGVYLLNSPYFYQLSQSLGILSPTAKCRTFDKDADGIAMGEGAGVVVLKKLKRALADKNYIYAVIKGSHMNHNGKTSSISAPSVSGQVELQEAVYGKGRVNPEVITYIEVHGTGTKIGDPIELEALEKTFKNFSSKKHHCALGSIKTNIGHTVTVAGVAGVIKMLLCMQNKQLPPLINYNELNEHINLENTPFYINTKLKEWLPPDKLLRTAAINSLGLNGTNVHLILEEYRNDIKKSANEHDQYFLIPISAPTSEALLDYVAELEAWLKTYKDSFCIRDIAYTLQKRSFFAGRYALIVRSSAEMLEGLAHILKGERKDNILFGTVAKPLFNFTSTEKFLGDFFAQTFWDKEAKFEKQTVAILADMFVNGFDLDLVNILDPVQPQNQRKNVPMPFQPFNRKRYWVCSLADSSGLDQTQKAVAEGIGQEQTSSNKRIAYYFQNKLAAILGVKTAEIPFDRNFVEMGLDSIKFIELRSQIEQELETEIPLEIFTESLNLGDFCFKIDQDADFKNVKESIPNVIRKSGIWQGSTLNSSQARLRRSSPT
jgi:amino acid adenylation domain-containing protein